MFWSNWPSSGAQVVEKTADPLSCCYTFHFKSVNFNFADWFTPLRFTATSALHAARCIQNLPMNQYA
jgi:hypothetical protein